MIEPGATHVDTGRDTASREGNDLKGGKVWFSEDVDFVFGAPWEIFDQLWGIVYQLFVLGAHLLVNNGNETYEVFVILSGVDDRMLSPSHSARLPYGSTYLFGGSDRLFCVRYTNVRLDEAKVTLNDGANILYPLDGTFLMGNNGPSLESIAWLTHQQLLVGPNTHDSMYSSIILDW